MTKSIRQLARLAGVAYLLNIVTGALAVAFLGLKLPAYGDASNLIATACYLVLTVLFYRLFKPVDRQLSLLATFFSLAGCVLGALGSLHLSPFHMSPLVFFGAYCLLIGYLIARSTFLPRILGLLMVFAGLAWLVFLWPTLARSLSPYIMAPGLIGEGALTFWLLTVGVNVPRWNAQAATS